MIIEEYAFIEKVLLMLLANDGPCCLLSPRMMIFVEYDPLYYGPGWLWFPVGYGSRRYGSR